MPVPVFSEKNAVKKHGAEIAALGNHAIIVTGRSSAVKSGVLEDIITVLYKYKIAYTIFDKVEENPSVQTVADCARQGLNEGADFVIGAGGGSPLDAAKAVAFLMAHPDKGSELLFSEGDNNKIPLVLIPTTCGTGSEVTPISVLTVHEQKTKKSVSHKIFADLAFVDGRYLRSAPLSVLRSTSLDALTHMIESYINVRADDLSRMFVNGGLELFRRNMSVLEDGKADQRQFMEMMNCSAMAGMAIAQTGTGIPHGLSYSLTYRLKIPHGRAVGYFTAGYLDAASDEEKSHILGALGFADVSEFQNWYIRLFGKPEVSYSVLEQAAENLWNNQPKIKTAPFDPGFEQLREIAFYSFK